MEFTLGSQLSASSSPTKSCSRSQVNTCGSSTRKRSAPFWNTGFPSKGCLGLIVILALITLQFSSQVGAASLNKRSADQAEDVCRTNVICGWEVYHPSTRNLQYYVASSCKCSPKETCLRAEDDISISAYVFRCRDSRKRKTTRRPTNELNETS